MEENKSAIGHVMAFLTIFIWANTFVIVKLLLEHLDPFSIIFYRFLLAYIVLLIIHPKFPKKFDFKEELNFFFAGLFGISLYLMCEVNAINYSTASNTGLLVSTAPIFTAVFLRIFHKVNIRKNFYIGFVISIIGVFLIVFNGQKNLQLNPKGDFLAILAAILWGIYSLFNIKIANKNYSILYSTRKMFFYGVIGLLPFLLFNDLNTDISQLMKPEITLPILFLAIIPSCLAYGLWSFAFKKIGAVTSNIYLYFIPMVTIITSIVILGEQINLFIILGCVFITTGVIVSEYRPKKNLVSTDNQ